MSKECFRKKFDQFYWLNKCEVTQAAVLVIAENLSKVDNSASASGL
jgi:hypothetical protein